MHPADEPRTMTEALQRLVDRKVASYRSWRSMDVCHADAVESVLMNSCLGPFFRRVVREQCEAVNAELAAA